MSRAESPNDLLTTDQAAALLGTSIDAVMGASDRGSLPAVVIDRELPPRQGLRLRRADMEAYEAGRKTWKGKIDGWERQWETRLCLRSQIPSTSRRPGMRCNGFGEPSWPSSSRRVRGLISSSCRRS